MYKNQIFFGYEWTRKDGSVVSLGITIRKEQKDA